MASHYCQIYGILIEENTHPTLRNQFSSLSSKLSLEARSIQAQRWMLSFLDMDLNVLLILVPSNMSHNIVPEGRGNTYIFQSQIQQHLDDMTRLRNKA